jgi:hypothetical protein
VRLAAAASAESLPFIDGEFDTVVVTINLSVFGVIRPVQR